MNVEGGIDPRQAQQINKFQNFISEVHDEYVEMIHLEEEIYKGGWEERFNDNGVKISIRREGKSAATLV